MTWRPNFKREQAPWSDKRMQAGHFLLAMRSIKSDRSIHTHQQQRYYKQAVQQCTPRDSMLSSGNSVNGPWIKQWTPKCAGGGRVRGGG